MAGCEQVYLEEAGLKLHLFGPPDAPPLVLVHGSGCDGSVWDDVAGRLAAGLRVIAIDLPGHGGSAPRADGDTMAGYVDAVAKTIRALGLERPALGGHSLGGAVVLSLALDHPDLAGPLVLVGTGARLRVVPVVIHALQNDFDAAMASMEGFAFGPDATEEVKRAAEAMMRRNGQAALLADFLACDVFDVMTRLAEIRQPTLVVCGEADALTPPKYSRFLSERMSDCRFQTIPGAGHMVMLEAPSALAEALAGFLEG